MGTLLKYLLMTAIWAGLFFIAYNSLHSRSEEMLLQLQNSLSSAQSWESYRSVQTVHFDDQQVLQITSVSQQDPYISWVTSSTKLTDTEDFRFEIYFQPETMYLHSLNADTWNKTDYTSSVAGELQALKDPFSFWQRLCTNADFIDMQRLTDQSADYMIQLKPFRDELYGIRFEEVERAAMQVRFVQPGQQIQQITLHIQLKNNVIRGYNHITYRVSFENINDAPMITLPQQAKAAKTLQAH